MRRCDSTRCVSPIYYRGKAEDDFQIGVGEHFQIGATTFTLVDDDAGPAVADSPAPPASE